MNIIQLNASHENLTMTRDFTVCPVLTLIYPAHFEDVPCQSGVNRIFEG